MMPVGREHQRCPCCSRSSSPERIYDLHRLDQRLLSEQGPQTERRGTGCDTPMKSGYFTAAWEDRDNADAYITCPSCGYQNIF